MANTLEQLRTSHFRARHPEWLSRLQDIRKRQDEADEDGREALVALEIRAMCGEIDIDEFDAVLKARRLAATTSYDFIATDCQTLIDALLSGQIGIEQFDGRFDELYAKHTGMLELERVMKRYLDAQLGR